MSSAAQMLREYGRELLERSTLGWSRFWFTPADPIVVCTIRVMAGAMIFYTHLVWTLGFDSFLGEHPWLTSELVQQIIGSRASWSHFFWIESPVVLRIIHGLSLAIIALFTVGLFTRWTSILTFLITVSYAHRATGALFGLDQINAMLAMYLMIAPCGAMLSVDRWIADRRGSQGLERSVMVNIAVRLIQLHMCIIYLFAGAGETIGRKLVERHGDVACTCQLRIPVPGHDLDCDLPDHHQRIDAHHNRLGMHLQCSCLASADSPARGGSCNSTSLGNRHLFGNDHLRVGDVNWQLRICNARGAAAPRRHRYQRGQGRGVTTRRRRCESAFRGHKNATASAAQIGSRYSKHS